MGYRGSTLECLWPCFLLFCNELPCCKINGGMNTAFASVNCIRKPTTEYFLYNCILVSHCEKQRSLLNCYIVYSVITSKVKHCGSHFQACLPCTSLFMMFKTLCSLTCRLIYSFCLRVVFKILPLHVYLECVSSNFLCQMLDDNTEHT